MISVVRLSLVTSIEGGTVRPTLVYIDTVVYRVSTFRLICYVTSIGALGEAPV